MEHIDPPETGSPEWAEEHVTRIVTDFELGIVRKVFLLLTYSFLHPEDSVQAYLYMQAAADLAVFDGMAPKITGELFFLAYEEAEARKA